jgi:hypothetical protein
MMHYDERAQAQVLTANSTVSLWLANCCFSRPKHCYIPSQRARIALVVADLNAFVPDSIFGSNELAPESGHP